MYKYSCPHCKNAIQATTIRSGATVPCLHCKRPLRIQLPEEEETEAPERAGMSPFLLIGCSGMAGLLLGGGLLAAAFLLITPARREAALPSAKFAGVITRKSEKDSEDKVVKKEKDKQTPPAEAMSKEEISKQLVKSCVWVVVTGKDGKVWHGTGCLIDRDKKLVLTNEHVASASAKQIEVLFPEWRGNQLIVENRHFIQQLKKGNTVKAKLVWDNPRRDLALIRLDKLGEHAVPLRLAARSVNLNQFVSTIGANPLGNPNQWVPGNGDVRGVVQQEWRYKDGMVRSAMLITSTVPINQGDSGGPLVNNRCALVGINALGAAGNSNFGHIDHVEIIDFLRGYYKVLGESWHPPTDDGPSAVATATVEKWLKGLEAPRTEDRIEAIRQLGSLGPSARPAVAELLKLLRNPNEVEKVRDESSRALVDIGAPEHEQAQLLIDASTDKESLLARRYAAWAMGFVSFEKKPEIGPALVKALTDEDREVRRNAADSLRQIGEPVRAEAYEALFKLLRDEVPLVRNAALRALMAIKTPRDANPESFKSDLANREAPREAHLFAIWFLADKGEGAGQAIGEAIAKDADLTVAYFACQALSEQDRPSKDLSDALCRALDHRDVQVREAAARAVVKYPIGSEILPAFIKVLADRDKRVYDFGLNKLPRDRKKFPLNISKEALPHLETAIAHEDPVARWFAAMALTELGAEAAPAALKVAQAFLKEKAPSGQADLLGALAALGPDAQKELGTQADKLFDTLKEMAQDTRTDKESRIKQARAAVALASIAPASEQARGVLPMLAKLLYLKSADFKPTRTTPFAFSRPEPQTLKFDADDEEMKEWAKKALVKSGEAGARAIHDVFRQTFWIRPQAPPGGDTEQIREEKRLARKSAFQVLARIGPVTDEKLLKEINSLFTAIFNNGARKSLVNGRLQADPWEFPDVLDAAKEAAAAMKLKVKRQ